MMPRCEHCDRPANVVYRATSDRPVPRCWDHAPSLADAISAGLLDSQAQKVGA